MQFNCSVRFVNGTSTLADLFQVKREKPVVLRSLRNGLWYGIWWIFLHKLNLRREQTIRIWKNIFFWIYVLDSFHRIYIYIYIYRYIYIYERKSQRFNEKSLFFLNMNKSKSKIFSKASQVILERQILPSSNTVE